MEAAIRRAGGQITFHQQSFPLAGMEFLAPEGLSSWWGKDPIPDLSGCSGWGRQNRVMVPLERGLGVKCFRVLRCLPESYYGGLLD